MTEELGKGPSYTKIMESGNKELFPKQLLLDRIDAANFFLDKMKHIDGSNPDAESDEASFFRYYFDGYISSLMAIKNFYYSQNVELIDSWVEEDWKDDLHDFLRDDLRNPIHHPNEWIDEPYTGISRRMIVVAGTVCFSKKILPDTFVTFYERDYELQKQEYIPVVETCQIYLDIVVRWVHHIEKISSGWFRVPQVGAGDNSNAYRPKYSKNDGIRGFSGNKFKDDDPRYVVRFYGTPEAIEEISRKDYVQDLEDSEVVKLFNRMESVAEFENIGDVNSSFNVASRNYR